MLDKPYWEEPLTEDDKLHMKKIEKLFEEAAENNIKSWRKYHKKKVWIIFSFEIKKFGHSKLCWVCNERKRIRRNT